MTAEMTAAGRAVVQRVLAERQNMPGALLPILHDIQDALGYVPPEAVADIAGALNLSRAEVHGVISYYHHLRSEPARAHVVQICRAEACQSMGGEALWVHACGKTKGADVTLEPVYCLGLCATAPAMSIDDQPFARVGATKFDHLMTQLRAQQKEAV